MAVWEHTEESFSEALLRSVVRMIATLCLVGLFVGPLILGGWAANAYIVYRTNSGELQLPVLEKTIPSPAELISEAVSHSGDTR